MQAVKMYSTPRLYVSAANVYEQHKTVHFKVESNVIYTANQVFLPILSTDLLDLAPHTDATTHTQIKAYSST